MRQKKTHYKQTIYKFYNPYSGLIHIYYIPLHRYPKNRCKIKKIMTPIPSYQINKKIERLQDSFSEYISIPSQENVKFEKKQFHKIQSHFILALRELPVVHKIIIALTTILIITLIWFGFALCNTIHSDEFPWNSSSVVEYGDTEFLPYQNRTIKILKATPLDVYQIGEQTLSVSFEKNGKKETVKKSFTVKDTKKPIIQIKKNKISTPIGIQPDLKQLKIKATDPIDGPVSYYFQSIKVDCFGEKKLKIFAQDKHGNIAKKTIFVNIVGDGSMEKYNELKNKNEEMWNNKLSQQKKIEASEMLSLKEMIEKKSFNTYTESVKELVHKINQEIWNTQYDGLVLALINAETSLNVEHPDRIFSPNRTFHFYSKNEEDIKSCIQHLKKCCELAKVRNAFDLERIAYAIQGFNYGTDWFDAYPNYSHRNSRNYSKKKMRTQQISEYGISEFPKYVFPNYYPNLNIEIKDDVESPTVPEIPEQPEIPESPEVPETNTDSNDNQESELDENNRLENKFNKTQKGK